MFAQNLAVSCLSRIVREERPGSIIIVGGSNCEGDMAEGILRLCPAVDYVFSGESEDSFAEFCKNLKASNLPSKGVVKGKPNSEWMQLPTPDFAEYFSQLDNELPGSILRNTGQVFIPYETSRGCWWGQKNHCTFCGLNANGMNFRTRNPDRAFEDLMKYSKIYPTLRIGMTDNIMPISYFRDLLPKLAAEPARPEIFYEQKSNLKRHQLQELKLAGILAIQPGIEALSTSLLKRMRKGVSAAQNISVLRDCRSLGIDPIWNLLYGFPGDCVEDYLETVDLIPRLIHLAPPNGCAEVSYDRFSPYFDRPNEFGISNLRAHPNYPRVYPESVNPVDSFAYHFTGDAKSVSSSPEFLKGLYEQVKHWVSAWRAESLPILCVIEAQDGYLVIDSRIDGKPNVTSINQNDALLITTSSPKCTEIPSELIEKKWILFIDGQNVGLASTTSMKLFSIGMKKSREPAWLASDRSPICEEPVSVIR